MSQRQPHDDELNLGFFFNTSLIGMAVTSLEKGWLHVNDRFCEIIGHEKGSLLQKTWADVTHPEDLAQDEFEFTKVLRGEQDTYAMNKRYIRADGSISYTHIVAQGVRDADGSVNYFLALVQDINEEQQIEEKLKAERAQMLALFESIDGPVYVSDPETYELLYANRSFKETWSLHPVGQKCYEVLQQSSSPCAFCTNPLIFGENLGAAHVWETQNAVTKRWYQCSDKAIQWPDGRWVRFELANDITTKKQAELLLTLQRDMAMELSKAQSLAEAIKIILRITLQIDEIDAGGLYLSDATSGRLNLVGSQGLPESFLEKTSSYPADSPQSQLINAGQSIITNVSQLAPSLQVDVMKREGIRAIAVMPVAYMGEIIGALNIVSHQYDYFSENTRTMIDTLSTHIGSFLTRIQDKEALVRLTQRLQASNEELQQFAYIASHDLQEPLRMVSSYVQLLQSQYADSLDETANQLIDYAVDGAVRMRLLINDLLAFSRVTTQVRAQTLVSLADVLQTVLRDLELRIQENNCQISYDPLPVVMADAMQMQQLLQNLISNALKFRTEKTPEIHIGVSGTATKWIILVKDNGIGIAPKYHDRIFEIFKRLHTQEEYQGTGIGLSICKRIVERHNGRIWVESDGQNGTAFLFTLPKRPFAS